MITQTLKLNLIPGQVLPRVNVSQYDAGTRTLQMLLYNGDQAFNISAGVGGFVQGTKPDRTGFQYAATVTQGSNVVTLVITQQMTAVSGEVTCELVLADNDNRIATVNFIIYVEPAALADDTVISDTELPLIEEAAELAQRIDGIAQQVSDDADRAETAADNAELWASRSPYIGQNGNWFVFDTTTEAYIDTQISATGPQGQTGPTGPQGPQGDAATITVGTVTTLPAGSQATVTNSGTSEAAVFNFGIPKGQDGTGAGDMAKADYDANGAVENAGGIASYVSGAISGKANTADLGTAAYKNSTNAVTNGSTDLVESGAVYSAIQNAKNKKVLIIADSYGMVHDTTFLSILKASAPTVYDGIGVSSIGFTPVEPYTFETQFDLFIANYTQAQKDAVTDVVICGGWNDAREIQSGSTTSATLISKIIATATHIKSVCTNAIVHPCFMAWHNVRSSQNQVSLNALTTVMNAYEGVIDYRVSALTDCKYPMRDVFCMDNSYFHPNETHGAPALAKCLHDNLFTGSAHYHVSRNMSYAYFSTNPFVTGGFSMRVSIDDNITKISSLPLALTNASYTGGIIGVVDAPYSPIAFPSTSGGLGDGSYVIIKVMVKGTINGVSYALYTPTAMYWYGNGNMLLLAPDGTLCTSVSGAYILFDNVIDNEAVL